MAFKLPTMTRETSSSTSTGDMVMAGAQSGYFAASAGLSNGDTTFLTFKMGSDTEEGLYTYNSGPNSFTRTQIYRSTNANAAVSWAAGTKDVICGLPGPTNLDAAGLMLWLASIGAVGLHGADIASASTVNLETATGDYVDITGTTTITAITLSDGHERLVRFTGALTLTNSGSLVLPGGANITTALNDFAVFRALSGTICCVKYTKANGKALVETFSTIAAQAEMEAQTDATKPVTSSVMKYAPGVAKAWVYFSTAAAIAASQGVSSITDNGVGQFVVNWTTSFSSANYCATGVVAISSSSGQQAVLGTQAAGTLQFFMVDNAGSVTETNVIGGHCAAFGDV